MGRVAAIDCIRQGMVHARVIIGHPPEARGGLYSRPPWSARDLPDASMRQQMLRSRYGNAGLKS